MLRSFADAGVMQRLESPGAVSRLAKSLMLIAEFWLPFEEAGDSEKESEESGPDLAREGAGIMMEVLAPRMEREKGQSSG